MTEKTNSEQSICGIYCDTQIQERSGGAQYFLDFLGCIYTYDSKRQNREFYDITLQGIVENIPDTTEQLECLDRLKLFMQKDTEVVVPRDFIEEFITKDELKQKFEQIYSSKNIELNGFEKDIEYITTKVKQMRVSFENKAVFSVDSETFKTDVSITQDDDETIIKVRSKISKKI